MPTVEVYTPATEEPVTIQELKEWLRITHDDEDRLLARALRAARQYVEEITGRVLTTTVLRIRYDHCFPRDVIEIPRYPIQQVNSIKYIDPDGIEQTLDASVYEPDLHKVPPRIELAHNQSWPAVRDRSNAITVEVVAGSSSLGLIPPDLVVAVMQLSGHYYEHREAFQISPELAEVPLSVRSLLFNHRQELV